MLVFNISWEDFSIFVIDQQLLDVSTISIFSEIVEAQWSFMLGIP